jgi:hypothetical protein
MLKTTEHLREAEGWLDDFGYNQIALQNLLTHSGDLFLSSKQQFSKRILLQFGEGSLVVIEGGNSHPLVSVMVRVAKDLRN